MPFDPAPMQPPTVWCPCRQRRVDADDCEGEPHEGMVLCDREMDEDEQ